MKRTTSIRLIALACAAALAVTQIMRDKHGKWIKTDEEHCKPT